MVFWRLTPTNGVSVSPRRGRNNGFVVFLTQTAARFGVSISELAARHNYLAPAVTSTKPSNCPSIQPNWFDCGQPRKGLS
jgi:hypothetical protein